MKRQPSFLVKVLLAALLVFAPTCVFAVTVTEIVIPISGVGTFAANAINDRGQVVGNYFAGGLRHCFFWEKGFFQTIDDVPATAGTTCYGINNRDQIVGSYSDSIGIFHDFLLDDGTLLEINVPGLPLPIGGINDRGQIVGSYQAAGTNQCFLWENGVLHSIDGIDLASAVCQAINNQGQIAGEFTDTAGNTGNVLSKGALIPISLSLFTRAATSINDRGQVVGLFFDNSVTRGFIFDQGIPSQISLPVPDPLFQNVAINNSGDLVVTFRSFHKSQSRMIFVSPH